MRVQDRLARAVLMAVFVILLPLAGNAQNIRPWTEGPLDWNDFGKSAAPYDYTELVPSWNKTEVRKKVGKRTFIFTDIHASLDSSMNIVGKEAATPELLKIHQRAFDICEFIAEGFRDSLLWQGKASKVKEVTFSQRYWKFRDGLYAGDDPLIHPSGEPFDITGIPFRKSDTGLGGTASFGIVVPFGSLASLSTPTPTLSLALTYWKNDCFISPEIIVGKGKSKDNFQNVTGVDCSKVSYLPFVRKEQDEDYAGHAISGKDVPYSSIRINLGKMFLEPGKDSRMGAFIAPGLTYSKFSTKAGSHVTGAGGISVTEGIVIDSMIHEWISFNSHESNRIGLNIKLYADQIWNNASKVLIPTFNLSVGLSFLSNDIKQL